MSGCKWRGITTRKFLTGGNVEHWLYNANAVIDELQEPKDDQRAIFIPEGEGKVDVLKDWGLLAVTNSGGAKNFTEACAEFFRNARQVVLLQDKRSRRCRARSQAWTDAEIGRRRHGALAQFS